MNWEVFAFVLALFAVVAAWTCLFHLAVQHLYTEGSAAPIVMMFVGTAVVVAALVGAVS